VAQDQMDLVANTSHGRDRGDLAKDGHELRQCVGAQVPQRAVLAPPTGILRLDCQGQTG
jgi:hypothetical protein